MYINVARYKSEIHQQPHNAMVKPISNKFLDKEILKN